jgi:DNA invertase Pin-like site-specific DNA recombinase
MTTPTEQNAISYTRFSSGQQARGSSLDRQSNLVAGWLKANPDVVYHPDLSPEDLGVSGYSGAHLEAGLGTLLEAVKLGSIGTGWIILIESYDRLGRLPPLEMMQLLQQLLGEGLTLVTLEDGLEYNQTTIATNPGLLFLIVGKVQQAHQYSQSLSKRLKASYALREKQAAAGQVVKRRTLFFLDSQTGRLKYPEADVARELFDLYLQGVGERALLKHVKQRLPRTGVKAHSTIRLLLQNKTCLGYWKEHLIYEPLVSEEQFYKVQQTFAARSRSDIAKPKQWLLTGLVKCGTCGSRSKVSNTKGKAVRIQCSARARFGEEGCSQKQSFPYVALDFVRSGLPRVC